MERTFGPAADQMQNTAATFAETKDAVAKKVQDLWNNEKTQAWIERTGPIIAAAVLTYYEHNRATQAGRTTAEQMKADLSSALGWIETRAHGLIDTVDGAAAKARRTDASPVEAAPAATNLVFTPIEDMQESSDVTHPEESPQTATLAMPASPVRIDALPESSSKQLLQPDSFVAADQPSGMPQPTAPIHYDNRPQSQLPQEKSPGKLRSWWANRVARLQREDPA